MAGFAGINVLIIGAGVSGLTTALCLAEAGLHVRVLAKEPPAGTTSAAAGASWGPYMVSDPRIWTWSFATLNVLESIALTHPESGVRLIPGLEASVELSEPPAWATRVREFRPCRPGELPERGGHAEPYSTGWVYRIPLVDMPRYLEYLERRLNALGAFIELTAVNSFDEVGPLADIVVNCTGLGARELAGDAELRPMRGQVVLVENPGIDRFFQDDDEDELTYYLPHGGHVVLGGDIDHESVDPAPDPGAARAILERCTRIEPKLSGCKVIASRVGFRPTRSRVRLEREDGNGYPVIHNYGHGGGGLTLSWGCARDVLALIEDSTLDAEAA